MDALTWILFGACLVAAFLLGYGVAIWVMCGRVVDILKDALSDG